LAKFVSQKSNKTSNGRRNNHRGDKKGKPKKGKKTNRPGLFYSSNESE